MEKTEITMTPRAFGKALPPEVKKPKERTSPKVSMKIRIKGIPLWKELLTVGFGVLWGNTTFFGILSPLGYGYLGAHLGQGLFFYLGAIGVAIGILLGGVHIPKYMGILLLFCLLQWGIGKGKKEMAGWKKAVGAGTMVTCGGVLYGLLAGGSVFYTGVACLEGVSVLCLSMVMEKGLGLLQGSLQRRLLSPEELLSLSLLAGGLVAGSAGVVLPVGSLPMMPLLATTLLLLSGYRGGAGVGAATGVLFGFLLLLCGKGGLVLFSAFALAGLFCGSVKELGRIAVVLSFFCAMAVMFFYQEKELLTIPFFQSVGLGGMLFLLIPAKAFSFLNTFAIHEKEFGEDTYFIRMKELIEERLSQFANAFYALGKSFQIEGAEGKNLGKMEVAALVDGIAQKVCAGCGVQPYCWGKDFFKTYQMTFSALSVCETKGRFRREQFPRPFQETCVRCDSFAEAINGAYENFRLEQIWNGKLEECRSLVSQQLFGVGEIMKGLAGQLDVRGVFLESMEKEIRTGLDGMGVRVSKVSVIENRQKQGSMEVCLTFGGCGGSGLCREVIVPQVSKVLGRPMKKAEGKNHCYGTKEGSCSLRLVEECAFGLATAVATRPKMVGDVCGDSTTFLETGTGSAIMAVSDGMGTGKGARKESHCAIELLEQFMEAGFEKDLSISFINSALLLRSGEETFATLDICTVDLYSARAEFVKIGAAAAYILRKGRVIAIRSQALPVGILGQVTPDKNDMLLKDGDIILLMTDGVTEAIGGAGEDISFLTELFKNFQSYNPQDVADYILLTAEGQLEGDRRDDMTVMAGRFYRRN